ncbi:hypothetical protein [Nocardioides euryhalodurans]|uniref:hypothetical protein n=1 Tax=Nocardioides euryhalodurans TaxID=2518370 RepID=UPI00141FF7E5|nr:hypothetical protein [Nocardioides euryhalodurans]
MSPRIPLLVAVVGALLVGGATTGSTRASWQDQEPLAASSVSSGRLTFTATSPAGVSLTRTAGSAATTTFVVDDTSLGKTLQQRITATVVSTPSGVTATVGTSCPGAASVQIDTTPTAANVTLCVRVVSSATATPGNVTLALGGVQRPSAGWTTPSAQVTVPVTVTLPPSPPDLSCGDFVSNGNRAFTWTAVSGETYTVYRSTTTNADPSFSAVPAPPAHTSPYTAAMPSGSTRYWRVRATNAGGTSSWSNTLRLVRTGNGAGNHACSEVTP